MAKEFATSALHVVVSKTDDFQCDVTRMRKLDYYSADQTWGGTLAHQMYCVLWGNPE